MIAVNPPVTRKREPWRTNSGSGHSHSIVFRAYKLLNILFFQNQDLTFTVRSADKNCCLGAIDAK